MTSKKILALTLIFSISFLSLVSAENYCTSYFSTQEQWSLQAFYSLFVTKKDYFKSKVIWLDKEMFDQVSQKINDTVTCSWYNYYYSYSELKSDLEAILYWVFANKYESWAADTEATQATLHLQNHLVKILGLGNDYTKPFKSTQDMTIAVDINIPEETTKVKADWQIKTQGDYDMKNSKFSMNMMISGGLSVNTNGVANGWSAQANFDILKAKDMYIKVNDVSYSLNTGGSEIAMMNIMVAWILQQVKGKYINITSWSSIMALNMNTMPNLWSFQNQPLMKFYRWADGKRYWIFEKSICDVFGNTNNECKKSLNKMSVQTQGKWYLVIERSWDGYVIWFTDKYMKEKFPWYEKVLYRSQSQINKMSLPLGLDNKGKIDYEAGKLLGKYTDDDMSMSFSGTVTADKKDINLTLRDKEDELLINGKLVYEKVWNTQNLSLTLTIKQKWKQVWTAKLTSKQVIEYLQSINIQDPTQSIQLQDLINQFQWSTY